MQLRALLTLLECYAKVVNSCINPTENFDVAVMLCIHTSSNLDLNMNYTH